MNKKKIGEINQKVISLLGLNIMPGTPILIGQQNIQHMKGSHFDDFLKYGHMLEDIIANPTYVALNPKQLSIEYIKVFEMNNEHVLLAVRVSGNGTYFARTLFVMNPEKVKRYIAKNALLPFS